jgi:hypothetical protein
MVTRLRNYLCDHLAGSAGAMDLIEALHDSSQAPEERGFFSRLKCAATADHEILRGLVDGLGDLQGGLFDAVGNLTSKAGLSRFPLDTITQNSTNKLDALEMLTLGIHGKSLLWRMLAQIAPGIPGWSDVDFVQLEREAIFQRQYVEYRRVLAWQCALNTTATRFHHCAAAS